MKKIIIYINAQDRIGIISEISNDINSLNGNIETSKMIKLGKRFNILMLISINTDHIQNLENKLSNYENLSASISITSYPVNNLNNKDYLFILKGADNEGIVYNFTNLFSELNINILDMETKTINAPITGYPLFYVRSKISIPSSITITDFQEKLNKLADTTNVAIKLVEFDENFNH